MTAASVALSDLPTLVGRMLGPSTPVVMSQDRIDAFAACTLDPQWIHVDPRRAESGPFGTTIAHGFLTLSLLSTVMYELLEVTGSRMAINYGLDRVRFPAPIPSGSAVRATVEVASVRVDDGHTTMMARVVFRADGAERPCCVADSVTRFMPEAA